MKINSSMFSEINLFDNKNKSLLNCFLFFFIVAICGYLSIMISSCPHSDDYCRYLTNINVGTFVSNRVFTFLLETFTYLSTVITDIAPFSHVLSCVFLAYGTIICLRIFNVNLNSKLEISCFIPVVVNPYMLEIMMFRFDNPFSTLALLFCIVAAYISTKNKKNLLFTQTGIFFLSLFMYQPASSAYFILGTFKFLAEIRAGRSFVETISKMRYWFYTILISVVAYAPFTYFLNHSVLKDGSVVALPTNTENIEIIFKIICMYYSNLYADWSENIAGVLFFFIFVASALHSLTKIKNFSTFCVYVLGILILTLCPLGACSVMKILVSSENRFIPPRCLYSIGILISGVLYGSWSLFKISEKAQKFFSFVVTSLCLWNLVFLNSAGNLIHAYRILHQHVLYDVAKDVHEIRKNNPKLSGFCFSGSVQTYAMRNFMELYPIMDKIIPEKWYIPDMCQIAMIDYKFADSFMKYFPVDSFFEPNQYSEKNLVRSHMLYDIFILNNKVIQVNFKSAREFKTIDLNYAQIGDED